MVEVYTTLERMRQASLRPYTGPAIPTAAINDTVRVIMNHIAQKIAKNG